MFIALVVAIILFLIAALHLSWGLGSSWPCKNRADLLRTAVGHPHMKEMPGFTMCFSVTIAVSGAAIWALWEGGLISLPFPLWFKTLGTAALAFVFFARGLSSYTRFRVFTTPLEPFATLDRRYYAPLCILLGVAFCYFLLIA